MASTAEVELKIYKSVLSSMFPNHQVVHVWSDNPKIKKLFQTIENIKIVSEQKDADILMLYKTKCKVPDKIIFIGNYALLKQCKDKAVGGFYWQKGRPNLLFLRENLKAHNIVLPKKLEEFIEDKI